MSARRSYGTGSLEVRADKNGRETYYGRWHANGRRVKKRIGPKRQAGDRDGLTRTQAESEMRRLIAETVVAAPVGQRVTITEVADLYVAYSQRRGRKPSTLLTLREITGKHLAPFFRERTLDAIRPEDVLDLVGVLERKGLSPKTIRNVVGTLSAFFNFARAPQRRLAAMNPCEGLELPSVPAATEIRFLTVDEVRALADAAPPGMYHALDRAMFLCAAMTGLRRGELVALRWRDVDWIAQRIRVRQSYVVGQFGTPKSKRSTRSVPMTDELAGELERLHQGSLWQDDDDLVFAHPVTGEVQPPKLIIRRMRKALRAARLEESHRFHDLRHTFGTTMAGAGVPMRTLQEWMGHRDLATTQRYADYAPSPHEADMVAAAFARGPVRGPNLSEPHSTSANQ